MRRVSLLLLGAFALMASVISAVPANAAGVSMVHVPTGPPATSVSQAASGSLVPQSRNVHAA